MARILLPTLHTGQKKVLSQQRRFNYLCAGRRWRKTTLLVFIVLQALLQGKKILWGTPVAFQYEQAWKDILKADIEHTIITSNENKKTITFPTGGEIVFKSLDKPNNARGYSPDIIIIDEAQDLDKEAWYEVLQPMMIDDIKIVAWIAGTPKSDTWFHEEVIAGQLDYDKQTIAWQIPTKGANVLYNNDGTAYLEYAPHELENDAIPFENILSLFKGDNANVGMTVEQFKQEILAIFTNEIGNVFRDIDSVATQNRLQPYYGDFGMTIDFADTTDFTVAAIWDLNTFTQVDMLRINKVGYVSISNILVGLYDKWKPIKVVGESNSMGKAVIDFLQSLGVPVTGKSVDSSSKPKLVRAFQLAIEKKKVKLLDDSIVKAEHKAYQGKKLPSGFIQYSSPKKIHDDTVIANMLGYYLCDELSILGTNYDVIDRIKEHRGI